MRWVVLLLVPLAGCLDLDPRGAPEPVVDHWAEAGVVTVGDDGLAGSPSFFVGWEDVTLDRFWRTALTGGDAQQFAPTNDVFEVPRATGTLRMDYWGEDWIELPDGFSYKLAMMPVPCSEPCVPLTISQTPAVPALFPLDATLDVGLVAPDGEVRWWRDVELANPETQTLHIPWQHTVRGSIESAAGTGGSITGSHTFIVPDRLAWEAELVTNGVGRIGLASEDDCARTSPVSPAATLSGTGPVRVGALPPHCDEWFDSAYPPTTTSYTLTLTFNP